MSITDKIAELCRPTVESLGVMLYEVTYGMEEDEMALTIFIDKPEGISLDDCERVSKAIDPIIEEADLIEAFYNLNVSSLGIDHPSKIKGDK